MKPTFKAVTKPRKQTSAEPRVANPQAKKRYDDQSTKTFKIRYGNIQIKGVTAKKHS
jgi:hypothetical protein